MIGISGLVPFKAHKDRRDFKDPKVTRDQRGIRAHWDLRDCRGLKDPKAIRDQREIRGHKGFKDRRGLKARKDS